MPIMRPSTSPSYFSEFLPTALSASKDLAPTTIIQIYTLRTITQRGGLKSNNKTSGAF